jgi:hypothetical protein
LEIKGEMKMETNKPDTLIYSNVQNVYRGNDWKSWQRLNTALQMTLNAGIIAGMIFGEDDFKNICSNFKGGYWFGVDTDTCFGEKFYSLAVEHNNLSACQSFENWKKRKPFRLNNKRICIHSVFDWKGMRVCCTSFADDGSYIIACAYESFYSHGGGGYGKPTKRFKITLDDLKIENKRLKDLKKPTKE